MWEMMMNELELSLLGPTVSRADNDAADAKCKASEACSSNTRHLPHEKLQQ